MSELDNWLQAAITAALEAGDIIRKASEKNKQVTTKESNADLVTVTDMQVELYLFTKLKNLYPTHVFIGEEMAGGSIGQLGDEPTWIIDPVDGTMNFVHEFPFYCVSIGISVKSEPVVGVIYNPVFEQLWYARKGTGCYKVHAPPTSKIKFGEGNRLISKNPVPDILANALILTELGSSKLDSHLNPKLEILARIVKNPIAGRGVRMLGAAAQQLCMIAEGKADFYYEAGTHCWDVCAGIVLVLESGGHAYNWFKDGEFDLLDRTVICIRGGSTLNNSKLVDEFNSVALPLEYNRD